jgi:flagellar assembly factor FliW
METKARMQIQTTRFGVVEVPEADLIHFRGGIIGFPRETKFALIPHGQSSLIAWLQSAVTPGLAFPVVSAHGLIVDYPDVPIDGPAEKAGLSGDIEDFAVLAVLCAPRMQPATVNLLAPVLINSVSRQGAQVFLEGSRFTTRELFVLPGSGASQAPAESSEPESEPRPVETRGGEGRSGQAHVG